MSVKLEKLNNLYPEGYKYTVVMIIYSNLMYF